jgi:hypothetical protein
VTLAPSSFDISAAVFEGFTAAGRLSAEEERAAVAEARNGSSDALLALAVCYAPALRKAVHRFGGPLDEQEAQAIALLVLWETAVDAGTERIARELDRRLTRAFSEALAQASTVSIPLRTMERYVSLLRDVDGDLGRAVEAASEGGRKIGPDSVLAIWAARRGAPVTPELEDLHRVASVWPERNSTEARALCRIALEALSDREREVIEASYGFSDYRPLEDEEIAIRHELTRGNVRQIRHRALAKMRATLGIGAAA